jgi:LmbE family N-acetylglucosaminyl deacetylase
MTQRERTVLVIAPHPDDEVLGAGGTIARFLAEGAAVHVAVVTKGFPPLFDEEKAAEVIGEAKAAHAVLGVTRSHFLDLPAVQLDTLPHHVLNRAIGEVVHGVAPDVLFLPFAGDIHLDHQLVAASALVAARPQGRYPRAVYAYETLSETNWNAPYAAPPFAPTHFVEVTAFLERKLAAMACYRSQVREFPSERSLEALTALAKHRGATVGVRAAEAFVTIRTVA